MSLCYTPPLTNVTMISKELLSQAIRNEASPECDGEKEKKAARQLSFCDLQVSIDEASADWEVMNPEHNNWKSSCSKEDLVLDLFSFTAPPPAYPPEHIIFCGKRMTPNKISNVESTTSEKRNSFKKKVFNWMRPPSSSSASISSMLGSSSRQRKKKQTKAAYYYDKKDIGKSGSSNRRWWMVMFGSVRLPDEMELADIRTRQKRRPPGAKKAFIAMFDDHQQQRNKPGTGASNSINGLIGLVRSFSCNL